MNKVIIQDTDSEPEEIVIFDVKKVEHLGTFFAIYPSFYNVRIVFSPLVIQRMLQWLIKEGYVKLEGKLTIKIRTQRGSISVSS